MPYELRERLGMLEARYTWQSQTDTLLEAQVGQLKAELRSAEASAVRCTTLEVELEQSRHEWKQHLELLRAAGESGAFQRTADKVQQQRMHSETNGDRVCVVPPRTNGIELKQSLADNRRFHEDLQPFHLDNKRLQSEVSKMKHDAKDLEQSQVDSGRMHTVAARLKQEADDVQLSRLDNTQLLDELRQCQADNRRLQSDLGKLKEEASSLHQSQAENRHLQNALAGFKEEAKQFNQSKAENLQLQSDVFRLRQEASEMQKLHLESKGLQQGLQLSQEDNRRLQDEIIKIKHDANAAVERADRSEVHTHALFEELEERHRRDVEDTRAQQVALQAQKEALQKRVQELLGGMDSSKRQLEEELRVLELRNRKDVADLQAQKSALQRQNNALTYEFHELRDGALKASEEKLTACEQRARGFEERLSLTENREQQLSDLQRQLFEVQLDRDSRDKELRRSESRVREVLTETAVPRRSQSSTEIGVRMGSQRRDPAFGLQLTDPKQSGEIVRSVLTQMGSRRNSDVEGLGSGYRGVNGSVGTDTAGGEATCFVDLDALNG